MDEEIYVRDDADLDAEEEAWQEWSRQEAEAAVTDLARQLTWAEADWLSGR